MQRTLHETHEPGDETVSSPLKDVEECSKERSAQDERDRPSFEEIGNEQAWGGLVESVLFFQDKGGVDREWDIGN